MVPWKSTPLSWPLHRKAHVKDRDQPRTILHRELLWRTHHFGARLSRERCVARRFLKSPASSGSFAISFSPFSSGAMKALRFAGEKPIRALTKDRQIDFKVL